MGCKKNSVHWRHHLLAISRPPHFSWKVCHSSSWIISPRTMGDNITFPNTQAALSRFPYQGHWRIQIQMTLGTVCVLIFMHFNVSLQQFFCLGKTNGNTFWKDQWMSEKWWPQKIARRNEWTTTKKIKITAKGAQNVGIKFGPKRKKSCFVFQPSGRSGQTSWNATSVACPHCAWWFPKKNYLA